MIGDGPHFQGGPRRDGARMVEATANFRDVGRMPGGASLLLSQLLLNLAGVVGREQAHELIAAFLEAADTPP